MSLKLQIKEKTNLLKDTQLFVKLAFGDVNSRLCALANLFFQLKIDVWYGHSIVWLLHCVNDRYIYINKAEYHFKIENYSLTV